MSPEGPRFSSPEQKDGKKDKKRKKNGAGVPLSPLIELKTYDNESKDKLASGPSALEKVLADLAAKRAEATENAGKPDKEKGKAKPEPTQPEKPAETGAPGAEITVEEKFSNLKEEKPSDSTEKEDEDEDEESDGKYEKLPGYELEPTEFSGGEVIIHLSGNGPVAERVIPLQAEREDDAPAEEPAPEEPRTPPAEQAASAAQSEAEAPAPETEPVPPAASGGGGGEVPPAEPPSFNAAPQPENEPPRPMQPIPEQVYAQATETYPADAVRVRDLAPFGPGGGERPATKQDVEDALYYAEKAGTRQGVLAGLLAGGLYEHFKHKRREKKAAKRFEKQNKELEQTRTNYNFLQTQQERQKNKFQRQYNSLEKRFEKSARPEKLPAERSEQQPVAAERLDVPENHRLETSAWHTIEVDAKTGKAVENPAFTYGHEYYRERAAENTPAGQRNAAAGEVALVAAATTNGATHTQDATNAVPPPVPDASTQGPPSGGIKAKAKSAAGSVAQSASAAGPLWPWLVALAVIVILLVVLL